MSIVTLSDRLTRFLLVLAAVWAFVLTFFIVADIIGRSVFNSPVYGVPEIVMNSIVMIVFLQAGYAIRSGSMLRADFVAQRFPPMFGRVVLAAGYLLGAAFFIMILVGGWEAAIRSWVAGEYEGEGALRVPAWPTRFTHPDRQRPGLLQLLADGLAGHFSARRTASRRGPGADRVSRPARSIARGREIV